MTTKSGTISYKYHLDISSFPCFIQQQLHRTSTSTSTSSFKCMSSISIQRFTSRDSIAKSNYGLLSSFLFSTTTPSLAPLSDCNVTRTFSPPTPPPFSDEDWLQGYDDLRNDNTSILVHHVTMNGLAPLSEIQNLKTFNMPLSPHLLLMMSGNGGLLLSSSEQCVASACLAPLFSNLCLIDEENCSQLVVPNPLIQMEDTPLFDESHAETGEFFTTTLHLELPINSLQTAEAPTSVNDKDLNDSVVIPDPGKDKNKTNWHVEETHRAFSPDLGSTFCQDTCVFANMFLGKDRVLQRNISAQ
ncbi:hypothetical protein C8R42DRAFT_651178 [Lentinula raphanica]|nr:hypothetical protein C8R42DRAFT_651178 [Lentinula raphanica]